jgi:hypothetical protein
MPGRPIRLAAIGCAAILALATGCARPAGSNGTGALGATTPTASPETTSPADPGDGGTLTATPTPTDPPATTPTPALTPTTHPPTVAPVTHAYPGDYAGAVLLAWAARDNAYLTLLTSSATAHTLLGHGDINTHWTLIRDDGAAGSSYASYYNNGGDEIIIRTANAETAAHHWHAATVQSWDVMTFPATASAYARKYVDGWIAGNRARMDLLGTTALTTFYLTTVTTPSPDYVLHAPFGGGGGDVEVEFTDTGVDSSVIIHPASLGHQHAIIGCDLGC